MRPRIRLEPWVCLVWAALVLILPLKWLLAAAAGALFHELCHLGAVYALGGQVGNIRIGAVGAAMEAEISGPKKELLAALAGPAGSFLLLFLGRAFPRLAVCGAVQGLFNLLPLYPMDGGRALRCMLGNRLTPRQVAVLEAGLGLLMALAVLRWWPLLAGILAVRAFFGKIPCKGMKNRVQ